MVTLYSLKQMKINPYHKCSACVEHETGAFGSHGEICSTPLLPRLRDHCQREGRRANTVENCSKYLPGMTGLVYK